MERRLILAVTLSLLILLAWSRLFSKLYHIENKEVTQKPLPINITTQMASSPDLKPENPVLVKFFSSQQNFDLTFVEPQAAIEEVKFKDYPTALFRLKSGFLFGDTSFVFQRRSVGSGKEEFVYSDKEKMIIKRFLFSNSAYYIELEIEVQNLSNAPISVHLPLLLGVMDFARNSQEARFQDVTTVTTDRILHLNARNEKIMEQVKLVGLRDRYFCLIVEPGAKNLYSAQIKKINPQTTGVSLKAPAISLSPGQKREEKFHIYLGPQDLKLISQINPQWSVIVHYGAFDFISHLLLQLLGLIYGLVHNWGWAIISLSLIIYFLLFPLTLKQMRSMKQMQALQPNIEELRKTYKDNPQRLNKEIMELYRKNKANPFGGCLPLIIQLPIFLSLYQVFMRSIALKGAHFLWIKDLSEPDRLLVFASALPILGNELNILPILMALVMFIQQKTSSVSMSGSSAEQQRLMVILFPILFGIIFYHMPAGLVLYWLMNSILMLSNQLKISRLK